MKIFSILVLLAVTALTPHISHASAVDTVAVVDRDSVMAVVVRAQDNDPEALNTLARWYRTGEFFAADDSKAAGLWAKAASLGHNGAVAALGRCYQEGAGVERDSVKAMDLYIHSLKAGNDELFAALEAAADVRHTFETAAMAHFYYNGIGVAVDFGRSAEYYDLLAEAGDVDAMGMAGLAYLNAHDEKKAVARFKQGALIGNDMSCYYYGMLLCEGRGVKDDPTMGFVYVLRAAEHGMANAEYYVSHLYRDGVGVGKSPALSRKWLQSAARKGLAKAVYENALADAADNKFVDAAYQLSWLVSRGSFVRQIKGLFASGNAESLVDTPFAHFILAVRDIEKNNLKSAKEHIKALAKVDESYAATLEAMMLFSTDNPKRNGGKAIASLRRLAESNLYARYLYGVICLRGVGDIKPDGALASNELSQAVSDGFDYALNALGDYHYEGIGTDADYVQANACYARAFEASAMLRGAADRYTSNLREGRGCEQNEQLAADIEALKFPESITSVTAVIE